jgi:hypothetical protein
MGRYLPTESAAPTKPTPAASASAPAAAELTRIALINGNYENTHFAIDGMDLVLRDAGSPPGVRVLHIIWWDHLTPSERDEAFDGQFPGREAPEPPGLVPATGVLASAEKPSPEIGAFLHGRLVDSIEAILRAELMLSA